MVRQEVAWFRGFRGGNQTHVLQNESQIVDLLTHCTRRPRRLCMGQKNVPQSLCISRSVLAVFVDRA